MPTRWATRDEFFHLLLVLHIGFLTLGVFKLVANALFMGVGDGLADHVVLTLELVDLRVQLSFAFGKAVRKALGDGSLHTVEVVLEGGVNKVDVAVGGTEDFLVVHLLDLNTLFLGFLDFLLLQLLLGDAARHDGLDVGLVFLEADTVAGLET